jgi:hypothetical protein
MAYWIMIFNQNPLGKFSGESLLAAITSANYHTLCMQYGLDPALIQPAQKHLSLEMADQSAVPYFLVRYQPPHQPPLVVTRWDTLTPAGRGRLFDFVDHPVFAEIRDRLISTRELVTVELVESQLADLGLVLAYEIARWAAGLGEGLVYGLDGTWYRLNVHHAFIPLDMGDNHP